MVSKRVANHINPSQYTELYSNHADEQYGVPVSPLN